MSTSSMLEALSKSKELEISFTGRQTGKSYSTTVWFVHENNRIYLLPVSGSDTNWYRNLQKNPSMGFSVSGKSAVSSAKLVVDPEAVKNVIKKFKDKYGEDDISKWYTKLDVAVELTIPI